MSTLGAAFVLVVGAVVFLWYAPGAYTVYKALHVAAIVVWVGGDVTLTTLGIVFERRRDGAALAELGKMGAWIGTRVYTPTLFAVLGFGIALVEKGGYGWGMFWIDFALAGWTVATLVGVGFLPTREFVCFEHECPTVIGTTIAWMDNSHLTVAYSTQIAEPFREAFRESMKR